MRKKKISELKSIIKKFDESKINYCLLRNYEFLYQESEKVEGLDTVVSLKDAKKLDELLKKNGFILRKPQFSLKHKGYFKILGVEKISFDVQIGGVYWNDMKYLDESVLTRKIKTKFFYTLSDDDSFIMLLCHSILGKRYFKKKYMNLLHKLNINKKNVFLKLAQIFNKKIAKMLMKCVEQKNFKRIKPYPIVTYFIFKKIKHLFTFFPLTLRWLKWKYPVAPLVSVVGPDGAGKSTLVDNLNKTLLQKKRKTEIVYTGRGRGHILPITKIGKKYKSLEKKNKVKKEKSRAENRKEKIKLLYVLASPIFTLDLLLRYWFVIFPKRLSGKTVITDRYGSDIMLMKHVPFLLKKVLLWFFPRPTVTILLHNEPEILHKRRKEEPIPELRRQMSIFNQFRYSLRIKTVDREKDTQKAIAFVYEKLLVNWW